MTDDVSESDLAVAQLLGMAESARLRFEMVDGRLVLIAANADWRFWSAIRACLDDLGVEAVASYFARHTPEERRGLSAPA